MADKTPEEIAREILASPTSTISDRMAAKAVLGDPDWMVPQENADG